MNWAALAYYRYEWVVQEIGDFGERVFWMEGTGERTKRDAVQGFISLFQPGDVVEAAYKSEEKIR
jgi:spectinomycin phosphotransferase